MGKILTIVAIYAALPFLLNGLVAIFGVAIDAFTGRSRRAAAAKVDGAGPAATPYPAIRLPMP
jgi:hypothetical protein